MNKNRTTRIECVGRWHDEIEGADGVVRCANCEWEEAPRRSYVNSYVRADKIIAVTSVDGESFHIDCVNLDADGPWDGETLPDAFAPVFAIDDPLLVPCDQCGEVIE